MTTSLSTASCTAAGPVRSRPAPSLPIARLCLAILGVNLLAAALLQPIVIAATDGVPGILLMVVWISATLSPITGLAKAFVFHMVAWSVASLWGERLAPVRGLAVGLAGEVVRACSAIFIALVVMLRGGAATPADLRVPQGVDLFVAVQPGWQALVAQHTGLFDILWIATLFLGFRAVGGMGRKPAATATACCWLLVVGSSIIRSAQP